MLDYSVMEDGRLCINIKKSVYSLKAIFRASYIYTDHYYIGIDEEEDCYLVFLTSKTEGITDKQVVGGFQNELLHQGIRSVVEAETKQIRELIVTRALYSAFIPEEVSFSSETENEEELKLEDIAKAWYDEDTKAE